MEQEGAIQENATKVMVALDVDSREKALALADQLQGSGCWLKVGMELYNATGASIIKELKEKGFSVFLDLKLHDIPNTVERAVRVLAGYGADMLTIHCSGGYDMMARAVQATHEVKEQRNAAKRMKIIGITVLTSLDEARLHEELGVSRTLQNQVVALAELGQRAGIDGVVASAQESQILREHLGPDFLVITPGIRPRGSETHDQARTLTPKEALGAGSSYLVVGRPITQAANPRQALEHLWD
ncbi:orotidine-5'-phosphate decarboxylase [Desulfitobacterium dichloroeliminans LMG P-21439]|uniref:Orotidine 5'-phosphate decarboxylase n=1 Tax=Desulfitobacterium dichloroeliminans (strain LMG P-21439 / DCA1) TaxID=871963 RepID=L0FC01_DESDL|nr:orotidine-5'-phosphate decarboxylase [Desulfitobacterium dichloroeliminans]AGA70176.1 orotidine-5'-phosphate decarboxylase [Desulfitobacterium dichloroeliminans LMG P-21439]